VSASVKIADAIDAFIDRIGRATSWLALILALVMGANVLLRYGFSLGWIWTQELEWHILVPLTLIGMSYALRHGEHVRVDVLFAKFSERNKNLVDVIAALLSTWSNSTTGGSGASSRR
jgi:TRAP-type mannitol/chloroaromatic compound transport system permease small subunit